MPKTKTINPTVKKQASIENLIAAFAAAKKALGDKENKSKEQLFEFNQAHDYIDYLIRICKGAENIGLTIEELLNKEDFVDENKNAINLVRLITSGPNVAMFEFLLAEEAYLTLLSNQTWNETRKKDMELIEQNPHVKAFCDGKLEESFQQFPQETRAVYNTPTTLAEKFMMFFIINEDTVSLADLVAKEHPLFCSKTEFQFGEDLKNIVTRTIDVYAQMRTPDGKNKGHFKEWIKVSRSFRNLLSDGLRKKLKYYIKLEKNNAANEQTKSFNTPEPSLDQLINFLELRRHMFSQELKQIDDLLKRLKMRPATNSLGKELCMNLPTAKQETVFSSLCKLEIGLTALLALENWQIDADTLLKPIKSMPASLLSKSKTGIEILHRKSVWDLLPPELQYQFELNSHLLNSGLSFEIIRETEFLDRYKIKLSGDPAKKTQIINLIKNNLTQKDDKAKLIVTDTSLNNILTNGAFIRTLAKLQPQTPAEKAPESTAAPKPIILSPQNAACWIKLITAAFAGSPQIESSINYSVIDNTFTFCMRSGTCLSVRLNKTSKNVESTLPLNEVAIETIFNKELKEFLNPTRAKIEIHKLQDSEGILYTYKIQPLGHDNIAYPKDSHARVYTTLQENRLLENIAPRSDQQPQTAPKKTPVETGPYVAETLGFNPRFNLFPIYEMHGKFPEKSHYSYYDSTKAERKWSHISATTHDQHRSQVEKGVVGANLKYTKKGTYKTIVRSNDQAGNFRMWSKIVDKTTTADGQERVLLAFKIPSDHKTQKGLYGKKRQA